MPKKLDHPSFYFLDHIADGEIPMKRPHLGPCLIWTGSYFSSGYGSIRVDGKNKRVHRWAYSEFVGAVRDDQVIDHLCRNIACVRLAHLEAVSVRENTLRGEGPSAKNAMKTHCKRGHPLAGQNLTITIRVGREERRCKACGRDKMRMLRLKK